MAMRPRTFRRLVLSGVLLAAIVLGAIGYFVIAPMQERRTIENLRADGMSAYKDGDYASATKNLRRYLRNTKPRPAEELLTFARAQARVEAGDAGHLRVSIEAYRSYMIQRPDDMEAAQELLKMFNLAGMFPEAKNLGTSLRANPNIERRLVLSEEITARKMIDRYDPDLRGLYDQLLALGDLSFPEILGHWHWLESTDRVPEAIAFVEAQIAAHPEKPGPRVLRDLSGGALVNVIRQDSKRLAADLSEDLMADVGWDYLNHRWLDARGIDSHYLAETVGRPLEALGYGPVALEIYLSAAQNTDDRFAWADAARRLYWAGQDERLLAVENRSTTVLGYQAIAARRMGDSKLADERLAMLNEIDTDFRAKAWREYLDGEAAYVAGNIIEARGHVTEAIDIHTAEPMFHQTMGEIHTDLGFGEDAIRSWEEADSLAGDGILFGVWPDPVLSIISSKVESGHLADAGKLAKILLNRGDGSPRIRIVWLWSQIALARRGMLDEQEIDSAIELVRAFVENSNPALQLETQVFLAEFHAINGNPDAARIELSRVFASEPPQSLATRALQIAQDYDLGMTSYSMPDPREIVITDPNNARIYAANSFKRDKDRDTALNIFEAGQSQAKADETLDWDIARTQFLDSIGDREAVEAWDTLLKANPDDIRLLYAALDSNSKGLDRTFVDATINKIMELTSSLGRAEPIRLRLARARAIAKGGTLTRSKRDESLSILRSIIATDPTHINARRLHSEILESDCPPEVTGSDRFEPDHAAAAAEKLTISRLIAGPQSRAYLIAVSEINVMLGNDEAARQNLIEAYARTRDDDLDAKYRIVETLMEAGEYELANLRARDLIKEAKGSQKVSFQLLAVQSLAAQSVESRDPQSVKTMMLSVLESLAEAPVLSSTQHDLLWRYFAQIGNTTEAEDVVLNAARYGLSQPEVLNARIEFAVYSGDLGGAVAMLRSAVEANPSDIESWKQLAMLHNKSGSTKLAAAVLEEALVVNPENRILQYNLAAISRDPGRLAEVVQSGDQYDQDEKLAAQQIAAFESSSPSMDNAVRISELERLARTFPEIIQVQRFAFGTLFDFSDDMQRVGQGAESASRRLGTDPALLAIAAKAYSTAGMWPELLRVSTAWRSITTGKSAEPDLYAARAYFEMKDYSRSRGLLTEYLDVAASSIDEPLYRELLYIYAKAAIDLREPTAQISDLLEPIARDSEQFRNSYWLLLARNQLTDVDEAVRWIQLAEDMSSPESLGMISDAWLGLSERFPARGADLTERAAGAGERWLASYPEESEALMLVGRALMAKAALLSREDSDRDEVLLRAMRLFDQAAAKNPSDLNHLFNAAQIAKELRDYRGSIARYEQMLGKLEGTGIFGAAVKNNLARVIELETDDPEQLRRAAGLALEAISFQDNPAFLNTLGWIRLKLGEQDESINLFRRAVAKDPEQLPSWAGLAITLPGRDDSGARQAVRQVEALAGRAGLDPEIRAQLDRYGVVVQVETEVP